MLQNHRINGRKKTVTRPPSFQQLDVNSGQFIEENGLAEEIQKLRHFIGDAEAEEEKRRSSRRWRKSSNNKRSSLSSEGLDGSFFMNRGRRSFDQYDSSPFDDTNAVFAIYEEDDNVSDGDDENGLVTFPEQQPSGPVSLPGIKLVKGSEVWIKSTKAKVWERAQVMAHPTATKVFVNTLNGEKHNLSRRKTYLVNPTVEDDVASLWHTHEPGILHNLEQRSFNDQPYTFVGPVLVVVNPLKDIQFDPKDLPNQKPSRKAAAAGPIPRTPHPYTLAERTYQQMMLALSKVSKKSKSKDKTKRGGVSSQCILINGESGAGKTEAAKSVLRFLVKRNGVSAIDKKTIQSNPILEAFGNAQTLRNRNSSRFGKFLKLVYNASGSSISGVQLSFYLLENSRVTSHGTGERNFHIFYYLLAGLSKQERNKLKLSADNTYRYLTPTPDPEALDGDEARTVVPIKKSNTRSGDAHAFKAVSRALGVLGISAKEKSSVFEILAGILHLGNLEFVEDERKGDGSVLVNKATSSGVGLVSKLFGVDGDELLSMFVQRRIVVAGETVLSPLSAANANSARDAVSKLMYVRLFHWLVDKMNRNMGKDIPKDGTEKLPFIGMLDIFGFEAFQKNDFEQLLINYTNEVLQEVFADKIFDAEMRLYEKEGLIMNRKALLPSRDWSKMNRECIRMFRGRRSQDKTPGILQLIDYESQNPRASDARLTKTIHKVFKDHKCFGQVHPKNAHNSFKVIHYAGSVTYQTGSFLEKNNGSTPKEIDRLFRECADVNRCTPEIWAIEGTPPAQDDTPGRRVSSRSTRSLSSSSISVTTKFQLQLTDLVSTISKAGCSFIRCIKPNAQMVRVQGSRIWFNREYVSMQMTQLNLGGTAKVLQAGFASRVPHRNVVRKYKASFPQHALESWRKLGRARYRSFVAALFWAFGIPRSEYKMGISMVFFRVGILAVVDRMIKSVKLRQGKYLDPDPKRLAEKNIVISRFQLYHARSRWRDAYVKVRCVNFFKHKFEASRARLHAAAVIQARFRQHLVANEYKRTQRAAVYGQRLFRGQRDRAAVRKKRAALLKKIQKRKQENKRRTLGKTKKRSTTAAPAKPKKSHSVLGKKKGHRSAESTSRKSPKSTRRKAVKSTPVPRRSKTLSPPPRRKTVGATSGKGAFSGTSGSSSKAKQLMLQAGTRGGGSGGTSSKLLALQTGGSSVSTRKKHRRAKTLKVPRTHQKEGSIGSARMLSKSVPHGVLDFSLDTSARGEDRGGKHGNKPSLVEPEALQGLLVVSSSTVDAINQVLDKEEEDDDDDEYVAMRQSRRPSDRALSLGSEFDRMEDVEVESNRISRRLERDLQEEGMLLRPDSVDSLNEVSTLLPAAAPMSRREKAEIVLNLMEMKLLHQEEKEEKKAQEKSTAIARKLQLQREEQKRLAAVKDDKERARRRRRGRSLNQLKVLENTSAADQATGAPGGEEEVDTPMASWAFKLGSRRSRSWKRHYFVLNKGERCITYFGEAKGNQPRKIKGRFLIDTADDGTEDPPELFLVTKKMKKKDNILEIRGGILVEEASATGQMAIKLRQRRKSRQSMFISFQTKEESIAWAKQLRESVPGIVLRSKLASMHNDDGDVDGGEADGGGEQQGVEAAPRQPKRATTVTSGRKTKRGVILGLMGKKSNKVVTAKKKKANSKKKQGSSSASSSATDEAEDNAGENLGTEIMDNESVTSEFGRTAVYNEVANLMDQDQVEEANLKDLVEVIEAIAKKKGPKLNDKEAIKQYFQLEELLDLDEIDENMFNTLVPSVVCEDGDEEEGEGSILRKPSGYIQVCCHKCGQVNNTMNGVLCSKCAQPLIRSAENVI